jgi:hypothetical protein
VTWRWKAYGLDEGRRPVLVQGEAAGFAEICQALVNAAEAMKITITTTRVTRVVGADLVPSDYAQGGF